MSVQLRRVAQVNPPVPELRGLGDDEVTFLPLEAVWPDGRRRYEFTKPANTAGYTVLRRGDVVMPKITPTFEAGRVFVSDDLPTAAGLATTEVHVLRPREIEPRYLAYYLRTQPVLSEGETVMQGVGNLRRVTAEWVSTLSIPVDNESDQARIADYLDRETATIDALIEKQNALLLLLRERRSQLPTRVLSEVAGTRMQLRHIVADITDCPHWTPEQADSFDYAAVRSGSIRNGMYRHSASVPVDRETFIARHGAKVVPGNVLFAREAPAGEACLVPDDFQLCLGQRTVLIECDSKKLLPELVVANIYTRGVQDYFANASFGSTVANVRLPVLRATRVIVPPLNEQREIAEHLDSETAKIDVLIAKAERFIELARERRAALITAAVTGQIEIPTED